MFKKIKSSENEKEKLQNYFIIKEQVVLNK